MELTAAESELEVNALWHARMNWTACCDDYCTIRGNAKDNAGYYPKDSKNRKPTSRKQGRAPSPLPASKEFRISPPTLTKAKQKQYQQFPTIDDDMAVPSRPLPDSQIKHFNKISSQADDIR